MPYDAKKNIEDRINGAIELVSDTPNETFFFYIAQFLIQWSKNRLDH